MMAKNSPPISDDVAAMPRYGYWAVSASHSNAGKRASLEAMARISFSLTALYANRSASSWLRSKAAVFIDRAFSRKHSSTMQKNF